MTWYYADENEQELGPFTEDQIREMMDAGTIVATTIVWNDTMPDWELLQNTPLAKHLKADAQPAGAADTPRIEGRIYPTEKGRSPFLSILAVLGPGLPQIVYGKTWMGVLYAIVANVLGLIALFSHDQDSVLAVYFLLLLASIADGVMTALKLNEGKSVGVWQFFPLPEKWRALLK